jgi:hypothetical protein
MEYTQDSVGRKQQENVVWKSEGEPTAGWEREKEGSL